MRGASLQDLPPAIQRALAAPPAFSASPAAVSLAPPTRMHSDPQRLSPTTRQAMLSAHANSLALLERLDPAMARAYVSDLSLLVARYNADLARLGPGASLPDTGPVASGKRPAPMTSGPARQRPRWETSPSAPRPDLPRGVAAAQAKIQYFETQQQQRCLQHAFNNLWQGPHMTLAPDLALQGADMGEICASGTSPVIAPDGACMRRIVLSSAQLRALIPVFTDCVERLLVFRGDVRTVDGAGHYHGLLQIDGHHFLLDSLQNGPIWLENPAAYYHELARTPFGLVAAVPGGTTNPILDYAALLQQGAFAAVCRALEDLHGEQPIIALASQPLMDAAAGLQGADVAAFLTSQGWPAGIAAYRLPSPAAVHHIDRLLDAALYADDKALLWTQAQPKLMPAFRQHGQWVARVPDESGQGETMTSKPLSEVLQGQQQTWDDLASSAGANVARQQEIAVDRLELGVIQMTRWPSGWPPAPVRQQQAPQQAVGPGQGAQPTASEQMRWIAQARSEELYADRQPVQGAPSSSALQYGAAAPASAGAGLFGNLTDLSAAMETAPELEQEVTSRIAPPPGSTPAPQQAVGPGHAARPTPSAQAAMAPRLSPATLQYTSSRSLPGANWPPNHRNELLAALRDAGYTHHALAGLTFAELNKKRASLSKDVQRAIEAWRKDRQHFPEGEGKQKDRVFIAGTGNAILPYNIPTILSAYDSQLAQSQQGSITLPGDWKNRRNALLAALRDAAYTSTALAKLTFAELNNKRAWLSEDAQRAIDVWEKDWQHFPKGVGKVEGRVFIAENGNKIPSQRITLILIAYDRQLAQSQQGTITLPGDWGNHRNALLAALRDAAYTHHALAGLTFAELNKKRASLSKDAQRAIDTWQKDWQHFPEETGKTEGRVFITKNGNKIPSQQITLILRAYDSKRAQL